MILDILIAPLIVLVSLAGLLYIFLQTDFWMGVLLPIAILLPIVYIIKRLTRGKEIEVNANGPHEVTKKKPKMPHMFKGTPLEVEYLNTNGAWVGRNNIIWEVE